VFRPRGEGGGGGEDGGDDEDDARAVHDPQIGRRARRRTTRNGESATSGPLQGGPRAPIMTFMSLEEIPPTAESSASLEGALLIAMPGMGDPRFHQTVIYMCSHGEDGAMGLIVNKPALELSFRDLLKQVGVEPGAGAEGFGVHFGGPVEVGRGFVLHSDDWEAPGATKPLPDGLALTATVDILRAISADRGPREAVLTLGYAGWGPGQLEGEIRESGWLICPADRALVFGDDHDAKWEAALRRIGVDPALLSARGGSA
jgi:putative transcriptional regulator